MRALVSFTDMSLRYHFSVFPLVAVARCGTLQILYRFLVMLSAQVQNALDIFAPG